MLAVKPIIVFIMLFVPSVCDDGTTTTTIPPEPDWGSTEEFLKELNAFRAEFARKHRIPNMYQVVWSNELAQQHNSSSDSPKFWYNREFPISTYRNPAGLIKAELGKLKNQSDLHEIFMGDLKVPFELINPQQTFIGCIPRFSKFEAWYLYCDMAFEGTLNFGYENPGEAGSQCPSRFKNDDGLCVPVDPSKHTFWGTEEGFMEDVNYSRRKYAKRLGIPNMHQMTWNESLSSNHSAWDSLKTRSEIAYLATFSSAITTIDEAVHHLLDSNHISDALKLIHPLKTSIGCMKKEEGTGRKQVSVVCLLVKMDESDWKWDVKSKKVPGSECMDGYVNDDGLCSIPLPTTTLKPVPSTQKKPEAPVKESESEQEGAESSSTTKFVSGVFILYFIVSYF